MGGGGGERGEPWEFIRAVKYICQRKGIKFIMEDNKRWLKGGSASEDTGRNRDDRKKKTGKQYTCIFFYLLIWLRMISYGLLTKLG